MGIKTCQGNKQKSVTRCFLDIAQTNLEKTAKLAHLSQCLLYNKRYQYFYF